jgi:hypothetical protein
MNMQYSYVISSFESLPRLTIRLLSRRVISRKTFAAWKSPSAGTLSYPRRLQTAGHVQRYKIIKTECPPRLHRDLKPHLVVEFMTTPLHLLLHNCRD